MSNSEDTSSSTSTPECPLCFECFPKASIGLHASRCTGKDTSVSVQQNKRKSCDIEMSPPATFFAKRAKTKASVDSTPEPQTKPSNSKRPLADVMKPRNVLELIGQDVLSGEKNVWKVLLSGSPANLPSMVLCGPPGCGKTSLCNIIAENCKKNGKEARFAKLSACTSGVADVKETVKVAKNEWSMFKRRTILFIDEIHRFNKTQQDVLLPHVEDGTVIFLAATTENPSFSLNSALLSRCRVLQLTTLSPESLVKIMKRALATSSPEVDVEESALTWLANISGGDARHALNSLETILKWHSSSSSASENSPNLLKTDIVKEVLQRSHWNYDCKGDDHFHCASALQKSVRGSNPDAALYWTLRMLEGGEKPEYIARRFVRTASEDIGLADPQALSQAVATMQGCQMIGKPECNILLAQCAVYLARAKKSHEIMGAMDKALDFIRSSPNLPPVPLHLRNATSSMDRKAGVGLGYTYDLTKNQDLCYMPKGMENVKFLP